MTIYRSNGHVDFHGGINTNDGSLSASDTWCGLDLNATDPAGFAYVDLTSGGRDLDYDWRIACNAILETLDINYGGTLGQGVGHRFRLGPTGFLWTSGYGWFHDVFPLIHKANNMHETVLPIGAIVWVYTGSIHPPRNEHRVIYLNNGNGQEYSLSSNYTALAGVWRASGGQSVNTLYQRIA